MAKIDSLFKMMKQQGASDLHISTGAPPIFRLHGEMEKLNYPPLSDQQARGLLFEILIKEQREEFEKNRDLDFAYSLMPHPSGRTLMAMHLEDTHFGASVLHNAGFKIYYEEDLIR